MSIIRVNKRKGFFVAPNQPFNDKNLSWEARGVMGYLLSKPDGWQCKNYDLANQTAAGEYVISRILKELKEFGYLYRYRKSDGRGKIKWMTEIYEMPSANPHFTKGQSFDDRKSQSSKESIVEKPHDKVNTDSSKDLPQEKTESLSPPGENSPSDPDLTDILTELAEDEALADDDFADLTSPKFAFVMKPEINGESLSLTESEIANLRTLGKLPGSELPGVYDIIQEIKAVWEIRNPIEELAIAMFLEAIRTKRSSFAIPKNHGIRNDWVKSVRGHLQDYLVDDLGDLYQLAITKLDQAGMTFSRPGSLTKTLPNVANEPTPTQETFDLSQYKIIPPTPVDIPPVKSTLTPQQIDEKFAKAREATKNAKD